MKIMKTYNVYFNDGVNVSSEIASFENMESAKKYVDDYLSRCVIVDEEHACSDDVFNSASVAQLEVYYGAPIEVDEDGEPVYNDSVFDSDYFYTK